MFGAASHLAFTRFIQSGLSGPDYHSTHHILQRPRGNQTSDSDEFHAGVALARLLLAKEQSKGQEWIEGWIRKETQKRWK